LKVKVNIVQGLKPGYLANFLIFFSVNFVLHEKLGFLSYVILLGSWIGQKNLRNQRLVFSHTLGMFEYLWVVKLQEDMILLLYIESLKPI